MKDLFPSNIRQATIQIPDAGNDILNLALIRTFDSARFSHGHVQGQLDPSTLIPAEPSRAYSWRGREADLVLARIGRRKGEPTLGRTFLGYDAVVVVKDFLLMDISDWVFYPVEQLLRSCQGNKG